MQLIRVSYRSMIKITTFQLFDNDFNTIKYQKRCNNVDQLKIALCHDQNLIIRFPLIKIVANLIT